MSKTFRKKFLSNKKTKSQFNSHEYIQTHQDLENSWLFSQFKFLSLNLNNTDIKEKYIKKIFHTDNKLFSHSKQQKNRKFFNRLKHKSFRNKNNQLLKSWTLLSLSELSDVDPISSV